LARSPTDIVELKVRARESLRARLVAEAERHQVSLNNEMVTRLEASLEDKTWNDLATAAQDFATSAQDFRRIATRMETEWERLDATRTFLLLTDLLTTKILDHNVRDESGGELSAHAWTEFSMDLSWLAKELRRLRASVDQQRREEWMPRGSQS